jgi:hypothetical protein
MWSAVERGAVLTPLHVGEDFPPSSMRRPDPFDGGALRVVSEP